MNKHYPTTKLVASHVNAGTATSKRLPPLPATRGPSLRLPKLHLESDGSLPVTGVGGIVLALKLWRDFRVDALVDRGVRVLRRRRPYSGADHVLAHVLNLFAGGSCIEDMAALQHDRAVLRMLGTERFPDPTTAGDFLRRFDDALNPGALEQLRDVVDEVQAQVWRRARGRRRRWNRLGKTALVDMDSHVATFYARQKEGADFAYTGQWSHHPLLLSLANTGEILAVSNRPGNVPSADGVEKLLDRHLPRVGKAFADVLVRGDSAFDRASVREACRRNGARFVVVGRSRNDWLAAARALAEATWHPWAPPARRRRAEAEAKPDYRRRRRGRDQRRERALERGYETKSKSGQWVAELSRAATADEPECRVIVVRESIRYDYRPDQEVLLELFKYRFVITDLSSDHSASDVLDLCYQRCDQENIIEQLKNELPMWRMPAREMAANAAWVELSRFAWNIGKWLALLVLPLEVIRWELKRFRRSFVNVVAQVVLRARQTWVRLNPSQRYISLLMTAHARLGP